MKIAMQDDTAAHAIWAKQILKNVLSIVAMNLLEWNKPVKKKSIGLLEYVG